MDLWVCPRDNFPDWKAVGVEAYVVVANASSGSVNFFRYW